MFLFIYLSIRFFFSNFIFIFTLSVWSTLSINTDPIPVTPEPTLKRPTHLDLMPVSNFNPKKTSPAVSYLFRNLFPLIFFFFSLDKKSNLFDLIICIIRKAMTINRPQRPYQRLKKCNSYEINWNNKLYKHVKHYHN